jgi:hypothetical protein
MTRPALTLVFGIRLASPRRLLLRPPRIGGHGVESAEDRELSSRLRLGGIGKTDSRAQWRPPRPPPPSPALGGSRLRIDALSHRGLLAGVGQGSQLFAYLAAQENVSAVDEEVPVVVVAKRISTARGESGGQLPTAVVLLFDSDHLHMVDVDPRAVAKPLPLRHG